MNIRQLHYLSSILHGKRDITEAEAAVRAECLQLNSLRPPFLVAEVAPYYAGVQSDRKDSLIQECAEFVHSYLIRAGFMVYCYVNEFDNVQVIFSTLTTEPENGIEETFINIRNQLQFRFELDSFIGIGSSVDSITAISTSARDASEMLAYKFTYAEQGVANIKNLIRFTHSPNYSSNIRFDRVIGCFHDGNIGKMSQRLDELVYEIRNKPNASNTSIKRTFIELTVSILHVAANADVDTSDIIGNLDIYQWILDQQHTEILSEWFLKLCEELHIRMNANLENAEKTIVHVACQFIDEHIDRQELSLAMVSDAVGLSSYYFSRLFKKEKGIGLNNYITMTRINHAKNLLQNTDLSLTDIAIQSGFSTASYFSQIFKKSVGSTPGEYRRDAMRARK